VSVRVAVIGYGVMGRYHAMNYRSLPGVRLVAVVDPDPDKRLAAQLELGVEAYPSVTALLEARAVDAASVAAPTSLHYSLAKQLLLARVHVLVEKPVATDVDQARELAELSRGLGLVLQVGHITRFYRSVAKLGEEVDRPYLIEARRLVPSTRVKDVGVILDLMIHDIDIVLGLVHGEPVKVSAVGRCLNGSPHEDVAAAQVLFADGCIARLLASRVAPDAERSLLVAERDRTVRVDFAKEPYAEVVVYRDPGGGTSAGHVQLDRHVIHEENPLKKELEHFLARQAGQAAPIGTLADDLRSLALASRLLAETREARGVVAV
jgi:predicted dehydrogenase